MTFVQDKKLESSYSLCWQICRKKVEKKNLYSYSKVIHNLLHYEEDRRLLTTFAFYKTRYNDFPSVLNHLRADLLWKTFKIFLIYGTTC